MNSLRRVLGPLLLALLVAGVGYGIFVSSTEQKEGVAQRADGLLPVRGLVGSEKLPFFSSPGVQAAFARHGLEVEVHKAGSRELGFREDLPGYDFAFPAGAPTGLAVKRRFPSAHVYTPFHTPMTIASWAPIAEVLEKNGIVQRQGAHYYIIDMRRLLDLVTAGTRWNELSGNDAYPVNKSILVSSTDVRKSNSGGMYLALASYVENNDEVVTSPARADGLVPLLAGLFSRQGFQESSSAGPFDDYLIMGMGKAPLVMIYEAQFIEMWAAGRQRPGMVLLYPRPTVFSKHTLVALTEAGQRVGELLETDPELMRLAVQHGLRNADHAYTRQFWQEKGIELPMEVLDVVDPPSFDILERMIEGIDHFMRCGRVECDQPVTGETGHEPDPDQHGG